MIHICSLQLKASMLSLVVRSGPAKGLLALSLLTSFKLKHLLCFNDVRRRFYQVPVYRTFVRQAAVLYMLSWRALIDLKQYHALTVKMSSDADTALIKHSFHSSWTHYIMDTSFCWQWHVVTFSCSALISKPIYNWTVSGAHGGVRCATKRLCWKVWRLTNTSGESCTLWWTLSLRK